MAKHCGGRKSKGEKKITRYMSDDIKRPGTPETGHKPRLPTEGQMVLLPMDIGWSKALNLDFRPIERLPRVN